MNTPTSYYRNTLRRSIVASTITTTPLLQILLLTLVVTFIVTTTTTTVSVQLVEGAGPVANCSYSQINTGSWTFTAGPSGGPSQYYLIDSCTAGDIVYGSISVNNPVLRVEMTIVNSTYDSLTFTNSKLPAGSLINITASTILSSFSTTSGLRFDSSMLLLDTVVIEGTFLLQGSHTDTSIVRIYNSTVREGINIQTTAAVSSARFEFIDTHISSTASSSSYALFEWAPSSTVDVVLVIQGCQLSGTADIALYLDGFAPSASLIVSGCTFIDYHLARYVIDIVSQGGMVHYDESNIITSGGPVRISFTGASEVQSSYVNIKGSNISGVTFATSAPLRNFTFMVTNSSVSGTTLFSFLAPASPVFGCNMAITDSELHYFQFKSDAGPEISDLTLFISNADITTNIHFYTTSLVRAKVTITGSHISDTIDVITGDLTDSVMQYLVGGSSAHMLMFTHDGTLDRSHVEVSDSQLSNGTHWGEIAYFNDEAVDTIILYNNVSLGWIRISGVIDSGCTVTISNVVGKQVQVESNWNDYSIFEIISSNFTAFAPFPSRYQRTIWFTSTSTMTPLATHKFINSTFEEQVYDCVLCYSSSSSLTGSIVIEGCTFTLSPARGNRKNVYMVTSGNLFIADTNSFQGGKIELELEGGSAEQVVEVHIANSNVHSAIISQGTASDALDNSIIIFINTNVTEDTTWDINGANITTTMINTYHSEVTMSCVGPFTTSSRLLIDQTTSYGPFSFSCSSDILGSTMTITNSNIFSFAILQTVFQYGSSLLLSNSTIGSITVNIVRVYDTSTMTLATVVSSGTLTLDDLKADAVASILFSNFILTGESEVSAIILSSSSTLTFLNTMINTTSGFVLLACSFGSDTVLTIQNSTFWGDTLAFGHDVSVTIKDRASVIIRGGSSFNTRVYDSAGGSLVLLCTSGSFNHDDTNTHSGPNGILITTSFAFVKFHFHLHNSTILNFKVTNGNAPAAVPPSPINISVVNCAFTGGVSLILTAVQSGASVWVDTVVTSDVSLTSNQFSESLIRINNLNTTTDGLSITTTAGFSNRTSYNISTVVVTTTISISLGNMLESLLSLSDVNSTSTVTITTTTVLRSCIHLDNVHMQDGMIQGAFTNSSILMSGCSLDKLVFQMGGLLEASTIISNETVIRRSGILLLSFPIKKGSVMSLSNSNCTSNLPPYRSVTLDGDSVLEGASGVIIHNVTLTGIVFIGGAMDNSSLLSLHSSDISVETGSVSIMINGVGYYAIDPTTQLNGLSLSIPNATRIYYLTLPAPWGADNTCESMIEFPAATCAVCGLQPWQIDRTPTSTLTPTPPSTPTSSHKQTATPTPNPTSTPTPSPSPLITSSLSAPATQSNHRSATMTPTSTSPETATAIPTPAIAPQPTHTSTLATPTQSTYSKTINSTDTPPLTTTTTTPPPPTCASNTHEASPCTYITNLTYTVNATADIHRYTPPNNTTSCTLSPSTSTTATPSQFVVAVPHGLWSTSITSGVLVSMRLSEAMVGALNASVVLGTSPEVPSIVRSVTSGSGDIVLTASSAPFAVYSAGRVLQAGWIVLRLRYTGPTSRSTHRTEAAVLLNETCFGSCALTASARLEGIRFTVELSAAPVTLSPSIETLADVSVVASAVTAIPSAVVRAGIANSLLGMVRCGEFDPVAPVDFINNPLGWAVGREELQYQRGSLLIVLVVMLVLGGVIAIAAVYTCVNSTPSTAATHTTTTTDGAGRNQDDVSDTDDSSSDANNGRETPLQNRPTTMNQRVRDAMTHLRLPSVPLVIVLFACQMATTSAASVLGYRDGMAVSDVVLALVVIVPIWGYMALYTYESAFNLHVDIEAVEDANTISDGGEEVCDQQLPKNASLVRRCLRYALEPSHCVVPRRRRHHVEVGGAVDHAGALLGPRANTTKDDMEWLRRNYYFVAEKRWPAYGPFEAFCGAIVDVLTGVPLTTSDRVLCIARPAIMVVLLVLCIVMLVVKVPNAVRLQQWSSMIVVVMLAATAAIATANAAAPSESLEDATGYLAGSASAVVMVLGVVDLWSLLTLYVPGVRSWLSLRTRSLASTVERAKDKVQARRTVAKKQRAEEKAKQQLATPRAAEIDDPRPTSQSAAASSPSQAVPVPPHHHKSNHILSQPKTTPHLYLQQQPRTTSYLAQQPLLPARELSDILVESTDEERDGDSDDIDDEELRYIHDTVKKVDDLIEECDL